MLEGSRSRTRAPDLRIGPVAEPLPNRDGLSTEPGRGVWRGEGTPAKECLSKMVGGASWQLPVCRGGQLGRRLRAFGFIAVAGALSVIVWGLQAAPCLEQRLQEARRGAPPSSGVPALGGGASCPPSGAQSGVVDDDRAPPNARFWEQVLPFAVVEATRVHQAAAAHKVWGRSIPGLIWMASEPAPALEAAGAVVHVVAPSADARPDSRLDLLLDVWSDVWARRAQPHHRWVVRLWDDNFVWRPGMERQIRSVEQLGCCTSDLPVLLGPRRTFSGTTAGLPFAAVPDRSPVMLSRAAMQALFGRDPASSAKAASVHRRWTREWCASGKARAGVCTGLDGDFLSLAALRTGVALHEALGVLADPIAAPSGGGPGEEATQLSPERVRSLRCRMPGLLDDAQRHLAPDAWALSFVPGSLLNDVLGAFRAGCGEDLGYASFVHATSHPQSGTGLRPTDFLSMDSGMAVKCWLGA